MTNNNTNNNNPFELVKTVEYGDGAIVSKTLTDSKAGTLTVFAFDEGQGLSEHVAPFDATIYILDGEARIIIDGQAHDMNTGEMIVMPANIPHAVQASKRFKMLLIMIRS